ncbi:MAG: GNAT family N-acetyltransferase [Pseudomonadota bacterium]
MSVSIQHPLDPGQRAAAAGLYLQAFEGKIGGVLGPQEYALAFLAAILNPWQAIAALQGDRLVGLVGFKTGDRGMMSCGLRDFARVYGWPGALWRAPLLSLLDRDAGPATLQMDGICVDLHARGQGIGTALLQAVYAMAQQSGCRAISLDVIDTNPRAAALYRREGFHPVRVQRIGPLRRVFGFSSATTMIRPVAPEANATAPGPHPAKTAARL